MMWRPKSIHLSPVSTFTLEELTGNSAMLRTSHPSPDHRGLPLVYREGRASNAVSPYMGHTPSACRTPHLSRCNPQ